MPAGRTCRREIGNAIPILVFLLPLQLVALQLVPLQQGVLRLPLVRNLMR